MTTSLGKLMACILVAGALWLATGSNTVPPQGWQVFSVFIAVIMSFVLRPFPMGVMVVLGLVALTSAQTITISEALSGYADSTVWLVVSAFLIAGGVLNTGLGRRIALWLVSVLGRSMLGLGYAISGAELLLGPVVPSNTARGGGIIAPIMNSLSYTLESKPEENPNRAGRFLALVGSHANLITASMFLTGMAANPLISKAVQDIYGVEFGWGTWALGAIVPGLIGLALLPLLIYWLATPSLRDGRPAQAKAKAELTIMGPMSRKEWIMLTTLILLLGLWVTKFLHGMSTTLVAWVGILVLLLSRALDWDDIIKNHKAWDTLIWLGGLLTMANLLRDHGFISWFAENVKFWVADFDGVMVILLLGVVYFYSMYAFSMFTAHISAMGATFIAVAFAAGGAPLLAAAVFAYFSCLCGCTTNYSSGPVIIYFGLGYVSIPKWFTVGFVVSIFHLTIWIGVGLIWWKLLGWY
jgi:DASS family divalent anion:Na+ symporter